MNSQKARHMKAKAKMFGFLLMIISASLSYAQDDPSIDEIDIGAREFKVRVSAEITRGCSIGSNSEDFGEIGSIEFAPIKAEEGGKNSTGSTSSAKRARLVAADGFSLTCTPNMIVIVNIDKGLWGNGSTRRLKSADNNYLAYDLVYITNSGQRVVVNARGQNINVPIGRDGKFNMVLEAVMYTHLMPSPIPIGVYEDTIQVTFSY